MTAKAGITLNTATPALAELHRTLSPAGRATLYKGAEEPLLALVKRHLAGLAATRHATAHGLGATPTGILGDAARRAFSSSDSEAVTVTVPSPAVSRAFRDVEILPRPPRRAIALPLHKWAYGVTPRDWPHRRSSLGPLALIPLPGRNPLLALSRKKRLLPMYVLLPRVTQGKDRSLMPSNKQLRQAAAGGMLATIRAAMARSKLAAAARGGLQ